MREETSKVAKKICLVLMTGVLLIAAGCEDDDGNVPTTWQGTGGGEEAAAANGADSGPPETGGGGDTSSPIPLSGVTWLHANVSGWAQTANLSVSIGGGNITLNYDKARSWPGANVRGATVNANPWVFVNLGGQWYAGTWEWFRVGQTSKPTAAVAGDHIKLPPLSSWRPVSGQTYGFMVSGLARDGTRNVRERSNIVMVTWP